MSKHLLASSPGSPERGTESFDYKFLLETRLQKPFCASQVVVSHAWSYTLDVLKNLDK